MGIAFGILALIGAMLGLFGGALTNQSNEDMVNATNETNKQINDETNKTNLNIARETNAANVEQAELAYRRSLPINQITDLMQAGMSKAGALNKLAGGGVYSAPALQSATMQAANMQAPHFDQLNFGDIADRLANIPATTDQHELVRTQIDTAKQELEFKKMQELREQQRAERERELHEFNVWKEKHGQKVTEMLDSVSNSIVSKLLDSDKVPSDFKDFDTMVKTIGADSQEYRSLPHLARLDLEQGFDAKFANARAERDQANKDISARDTHDLAEYEKQIQKLNRDTIGFDLSEKQKSQLLRFGLIAQQIESNKYDLDNKHKDAILRDLGFENEQIARDYIADAEATIARIKRSSAYRAENRPEFLVDIVENFSYYADKLNPLKGLFKFGSKE